MLKASTPDLKLNTSAYPSQHIHDIIISSISYINLQLMVIL